MKYRHGLFSLLACSVVATAALPAGYPPPGEYQIDSDAVMTFGAMAGMERLVHTDGATGTQTITSKGPDGSVTTQVYKGDKPVIQCIKVVKATDLKQFAPFTCKSLNPQSTATDSSFSAACRGLDADSTFRMIDSRTWEHTGTMQVHADRTPARTAREALAMASAVMTPAERAEAQKALNELPSDAETDRMNAELLRELEENVRTADSPEDAEAARQGVQMLRQQMNGTAVQQTVRTTERYTLLSATCH